MQNDYDLDLNLDSPFGNGVKEPFDPNQVVSNKFSEN